VSKSSTYAAIIESIFRAWFRPGMREVEFAREDIVRFGNEHKVALPKNLGDLVYSFRYRKDLPQSIRSTAGEGQAWIIRPAGRGRYRFVLVKDVPLLPNENMAVTKIPDATPGIILRYSFNDEQALLAKVRYNRLIDIFTGITCYSLQNHLRTTVPTIGQVEIDELYVGVDKRGVHYVFPVQAKGGADKLSIVQVEQDASVCSHRFPALICRPVAAQFMRDGVIVLFEFENGEDGVVIASERHYRLVAQEDVTADDLIVYGNRVP